MGTSYLLSILLLIPVVFSVVIGFVPARQAKVVALVSALATFFVSLVLFGYDPRGITEAATAANQFQFVENRYWFPQFGISYHLGVDGPAMLLIVMTTFLQIFAVTISWNSIQDRTKEYFIFLTLLETAMIGAFCALDLVLFYIFFEGCLIPMYFLIGIWGGPRRIYAAVKFFLYTLIGSLLMLVAIFALFLYVRSYIGGVGSFDYMEIKDVLVANPLPIKTALLMFGAFSLAFAIKVPMFPFHTWLPDAHVEAPTAGSVILAGVLLKLGTYGFYRFCLPLFPEAAQLAAPLIITLAVIGIIYGALVAAMQRDVKKLVAYSSVSHLGFVMLGLFSFTSYGLSGAILQSINHGISTGALFLLVGMIYDRRHTRMIRDFGGLWEQMPVFGRIFLIVTLSSIGLPLTNGFVGEFLILLGAFQTFPMAAALATSGVILSAIYMLWMFQRVMYGPVDRMENRRLRDLDRRELATILPFVVMIFWLGIYPTTFTRMMDPSLGLVLRDVRLDQEPAVYGVTEATRPQPGGGTRLLYRRSGSAPREAGGGGAPPGAGGGPGAPGGGGGNTPPAGPAQGGGALTAPVGGSDTPASDSPPGPDTGAAAPGAVPAPTPPRSGGPAVMDAGMGGSPGVGRGGGTPAYPTSGGGAAPGAGTATEGGAPAPAPGPTSEADSGGGGGGGGTATP